METGLHCLFRHSVCLALLFELFLFLKSVLWLTRWAETSSFRYFSPLTQDNTHIVETSMTGQQALVRRRKVGELQLLGGPVQNPEGVGRRLHSGIKNIQFSSFGKSFGKTVGQFRVWWTGHCSVSYFPACHCNERWSFLGLLVSGKSTSTSKHHRLCSVYQYCPVIVFWAQH